MQTSNLHGALWSDEDYLIVLNAYLENRNCIHDQALQERLSDLIGRTPRAVGMRLENYASLDGGTPRIGLGNVGFRCREIFEKWRNDPDKLKTIASYFEEKATAPGQTDLFKDKSFEMPKAFSKYELYDFLGEGGFGRVYSCLDTENDELRALKVVKQENLADSEILARFGREIRSLRKVSDTNVIRLYEDNLETERSLPGFIMELAVENLESFAKRHARSRSGSGSRPVVPPELAVEIVLGISRGVEVLHSCDPPIVHRDINPSNILLMPDGRWVLSDFSLAKFLETAPNNTTAFVTRSNQGWSTEGYSSPEQRSNFKNTNIRSDIYSLGVLVLELFSGDWYPRRPGESGLPQQLDSLISRANEWEEADRHSSVTAFREEFEIVAKRLFGIPSQ